MKHIVFVFILVLTLGCPLIAFGAEAQVPPKGYVLIENGQDGTARYQIYMPEGQTKNNWKEKLVITIYRNEDGRINRPVHILDTISSLWNTACPNGRVSDVVMDQQHPLSPVYMEGYCPKSRFGNDKETSAIRCAANRNQTICFERTFRGVFPTESKKLPAYREWLFSVVPTMTLQ